MLPFRKILCPTDFSEPSYEAIKAAGELASHFESELCLLHVVSPVPVVPMGAEPSAFNIPLYEQELEASSKRSLEEMIHQLEWKELKVRLIVLRGNAADEIVRTADEENADLIVIATHGRTGLDRLIFGSVAEKVVRLAKCPIFTVASQPLKDEGEEGHPEKGELTMSTTEMKSPEEKSEKKKAYQEKIETQLKEWGARIEELKAKAEMSRTELKVKYQKQIEDLRVKQEVVQQKLRQLKESGAETWEGLRTGIEKSLGELKGSLDSTISTFKEKGGEAAERVLRKKEDYVRKMEAELKKWGHKIDILKAKAEKSKVEAKITYLKQIEELRAKQESVKQKVHDLKESGDEAWREIRKGVDKAVGEMKEAFRRAKSKLQKKQK
jgi:nucleotide-binding universal stress UspA family protein